ncbi:hypothetical protein VTL71DRAFT_16534 [Oculimacula yallundae]|uniref:Uncharacterized protein n=1 Tax=Oculimacula yallundae TaxID=86028 RepID=A0ABR4CG00_9HELO
MAAKYSQVSNALGEYYEKTGFSHAVILPPGAQLVITSGQPGIGLSGYSDDPSEQFEQTLDNCDAALKAAGVKEGLFKAHKIHCFLTDTSLEPILMEVWRRKWPNHKPTWMSLGVSALCGDKMIVEIQVEAHLVPSSASSP